jgi:hypothetical protein
MGRTEFDFDSDDDGRAAEAAGSPEGDGDFESDSLPATGETSAGGQPPPRADDPEQADETKHEPHGLERVIDEISHGTLLP